MSAFATNGQESESGDSQNDLNLARAGSVGSLAKLVEQCRQYLLLVANRELDSELRAKVGASDLVQDTLIQAQSDFPQFAGTSEAELRAWLRKILINRVYSAARRFRGTDKRNIDREQPLTGYGSQVGARPLTSNDPTPSQQAVMNEEQVLLANRLAELPRDYQLVIRLRSLERLPFAEIGRAMDRSEEAAHKLWLRAIKRLQSEVDQDE